MPAVSFESELAELLVIVDPVIVSLKYDILAKNKLTSKTVLLADVTIASKISMCPEVCQAFKLQKTRYSSRFCHYE